VCSNTRNSEIHFTVSQYSLAGCEPSSVLMAKNDTLGQVCFKCNLPLVQKKFCQPRVPSCSKLLSFSRNRNVEQVNCLRGAMGLGGIFPEPDMCQG